MYVAIVDDDTCETCLDNENQLVYTDDEIEDEFPDRHVLSDNEIYPNVHMTLWGKDGTCRCRLFRYSSKGAGAGDEPELPKGPISDKEFDDWVSGLLAAGYITAAVYDSIVARRKRKKDVKQK